MPWLPSALMNHVKSPEGRPGLGMSICNPATWKAEAGRSQDQGLLGQGSEICLRIKEVRLGIIAQWVEYLPATHTFLGSSPSNKESIRIDNGIL